MVLIQLTTLALDYLCLMFCLRMKNKLDGHLSHFLDILMNLLTVVKSVRSLYKDAVVKLSNGLVKADCVLKHLKDTKAPTLPKCKKKMVFILIINGGILRFVRNKLVTSYHEKESAELSEISNDTQLKTENLLQNTNV